MQTPHVKFWNAPMRTLKASIASLLLVMALATTAQAQTTSTKTTFKGPGLEVSCFSYDSNTGASTYIDLYGIQSTSHTQGGAPTTQPGAFLYYDTYNPSTGEDCFIYTNADPGSVSLTGGSRKLETQTLSATFTATEVCVNYNTGAVTFQDCLVTVDNLTLTGTGDISKSTFTFGRSSPGNYKYSYRNSGSFRNATVTGGTFNICGTSVSTADCYSTLFYSNGGILDVSH